MTERSLSHMLNLVRFPDWAVFLTPSAPDIIWFLSNFTLKFHLFPRPPGSTKKQRTAQSRLNPRAGLKNVTAPPCCLRALCRRWGMTYSSTSACLRSSRYLSCSSHLHSSTGSATWGTVWKLQYFSTWETNHLLCWGVKTLQAVFIRSMLITTSYVRVLISAM